LISEELERLLQQEVPKAPGKTWAAVIAESLLRQAVKGDVRAISEMANRVEGKPVQAVLLDSGSDVDPAERLRELLARAEERMKAEKRNAKQPSCTTNRLNPENGGAPEE
jgi:hypothetical protein